MPCSNCNAEITCGCQYRTASDGASVCTGCADAYELGRTATPPTPPQPEPQARLANAHPLR